MVPKTCSASECERPSKARGYCTKHYQQWERNTPKGQRVQPTSAERFWAKVDQSNGVLSCWHWQGTIDPETGYGSVRVNYQLKRSHRHAYELRNGPIPAGAVIDHDCHNNSGCTDVPCAHRKCVNPRHLEAVSQSLNTERGRSGSHNSDKTHCPQGHPYSPENTLPQHNGRGRRCRECGRLRAIVTNARKREKKKTNG